MATSKLAPSEPSPLDAALRALIREEMDSAKKGESEPEEAAAPTTHIQFFCIVALAINVMLLLQQAPVDSPAIQLGFKIFTSLFGGMILIYTEKFRSVLLSFAAKRWNQVLQFALLGFLLLFRTPIVAFDAHIKPETAQLIIDGHQYPYPEWRTIHLSIASHEVVIRRAGDDGKSDDNHARTLGMSRQDMMLRLVGRSNPPTWGPLYRVSIELPRKKLAVKVMPLDGQTITDLPGLPALAKYEPTMDKDGGLVLCNSDGSTLTVHLPAGKYRFSTYPLPTSQPITSETVVGEGDNTNVDLGGDAQ